MTAINSSSGQQWLQITVVRTPALVYVDAESSPSSPTRDAHPVKEVHGGTNWDEAMFLYNLMHCK